MRVLTDQLQRNIGERLAVVEPKVDDLRQDANSEKEEAMTKGAQAGIAVWRL
ncbi:MAG: hypothetical protein IPK75_20200 [Acidobacteria bacterium]|nr:hypothetical protein [Acidobacteriota bacterium]